MSRFYIACVLLSLTATSFIHAQQPAEKKDPQSAFESRSAPGAGQ